MFELRTLVGVACVGAGVVAGFGLFTNHYITRKYAKMPYTLMSLDLLHKYPSTSKYLGDQIKPGTIKVYLERDKFNCINPDNTRLKVPLFGNKAAGFLYLWARRKHEHEDISNRDEWIIRRLDLQLLHPDRRWKFYETEDVEKDEPVKQEASNIEHDSNDSLIYISASKQS